MSFTEFNWKKIHKWEDNYLRQVDEDVEEYVLEFFGVEEVPQLTEKQMQAVMRFSVEELPDYHIMQSGIATLLYNWEEGQQ